MRPDKLEALMVKLGMQNIRVANGNLYACCPNHDERRPSWGIKLEAPHVHGCWGCGYRGTLRDMLQYKFRWSHERISNTIGGPSIYLEDAELFKEKKEEQFPDDTELFAYDIVTKKAVEYMRSRGIIRKTMRSARIGYDRLCKRVIFPYFLGGTYRGATGRTILPKGEPKILAYGGIKKERLLYLPSGEIPPESDLVLCEGEIDALKLHQALPRCCIGALAFGSLTKAQIALVIRHKPRHITLFFDNDATGQRLNRAAKKAFNRFPVYLVNYDEAEDCKDPGDMTTEQIRAVYDGRKKVALIRLEMS